MSMPAAEQDARVATVAKPDLIAAWRVLEVLTVSLHKIGSAHATPSATHEQDPEQRQHMLEALDAYLTPDLFEEISQARSRLREYLPDDEAEAISDSLNYWQSPAARA